jgi:hypothetical protein
MVSSCKHANEREISGSHGEKYKVDSLLKYCTVYRMLPTDASELLIGASIKRRADSTRERLVKNGANLDKVSSFTFRVINIRVLYKALIS